LKRDKGKIKAAAWALLVTLVLAPDRPRLAEPGPLRRGPAFATLFAVFAITYKTCHGTCDDPVQARAASALPNRKAKVMDLFAVGPLEESY
jgi:hypothetical protein